MNNTELMIKALEANIRILTAAINDPRNLGMKKNNGEYIFHRCREYRMRQIEKMQSEIQALRAEKDETNEEKEV